MSHRVTVTIVVPVTVTLDCEWSVREGYVERVEAVSVYPPDVAIGELTDDDRHTIDEAVRAVRRAG